MLAALAVGVAFYGVGHFSVFYLMFGMFPSDLAEPTAGFLFGSVPVLAGALTAPRKRLVAAIVLFSIGVPLTFAMLEIHLLSAIVGGLCAIGFVAWWSHPRRTLRSALWVGIAVVAGLFCFFGLVHQRFVDQPAWPDELEWELTEALGPSASQVKGFYLYELGGFIDSQFLWRIDANAEVVALIVRGLDLQRTDRVPVDFWQMPPHYWPTSMPARAQAFLSQDFSADERGPDGRHYFMVYDETQERAFVWIKDNF